MPASATMRLARAYALATCSGFFVSKGITLMNVVDLALIGSMPPRKSRPTSAHISAISFCAAIACWAVSGMTGEKSTWPPSSPPDQPAIL